MNLIIALAKYMGLGISYVIMANHMISLITSSTADPRLLLYLFGESPKEMFVFLNILLFLFYYILDKGKRK